MVRLRNTLIEVSAERVHELLDRLANLLRAEARHVGAAQGLQPVQVHALAYLARANRYSDSPLAVAEFLGLTKGTVSQTIALLEQKGLLVSEPDARDGRRQHLRLTPKGRRVLQKLPPEPLVAALAVGGQAESLARLLGQLLEDLLQLRGGRSFGVCSTCRHHRPGGAFVTCGLVGERLAADQFDRICREHAPVAAT